MQATDGFVSLPLKSFSLEPGFPVVIPSSRWRYFAVCLANLSHSALEMDADRSLAAPRPLCNVRHRVPRHEQPQHPALLARQARRLYTIVQVDIHEAGVQIALIQRVLKSDQAGHGV